MFNDDDDLFAAIERLVFRFSVEKKNRLHLNESVIITEIFSEQAIYLCAS